MKHITNLVPATFIALLGYFGVYALNTFGGIPGEIVTPINGMTPTGWNAGFLVLVFVNVLLAWISYLFWYFYAQTRKITKISTSSQRTVWLTPFLALMLASIVCSVVTSYATLEMAWLACIFHFVSLPIYYLMTVFFSPSSFKYTPWGASKLRRSW